PLLTLRSISFAQGDKIPVKFTCDGDNISPELQIGGVPAEAKSLVLIMDDPDASSAPGGVFDHWVAFNIPTTTTEIAQGVQPLGTKGKGSGGGLIYQGPCPPSGTHHYRFK